MRRCWVNGLAGWGSRTPMRHLPRREDPGLGQPRRYVRRRARPELKLWDVVTGRERFPWSGHKHFADGSGNARANGATWSQWRSPEIGPVAVLVALVVEQVVQLLPRQHSRQEVAL